MSLSRNFCKYIKQAEKKRQENEGIQSCNDTEKKRTIIKCEDIAAENNISDFTKNLRA